MSNRIVLHVFDRASGGVPEAILDFIANSSEKIQHLVYGPADATIRSRVDKVAKFFEANKNPILRPLEIKKILKKYSNSTVHAHSSISGAIVRIFFSSKKLRIIYSPHCFAFERTDIGEVRKFLFRSVEKLLSQNTSVIAACSLREKALAQSLSRKELMVQFVPNVSRLDLTETKKTRVLPPLTFVSVGRLSEQKNPLAFADLIQRTGDHVGDKLVWVGDGDDFFRKKLLPKKIQITGWLSENDVGKKLKSCDVYVHVARWEGFPLAVLDAFNAGLPIIVEPIPAYGELAPIQTIDFASGQIHKDFNRFFLENRAAWAKTLEMNTIPEQKKSLELIWSEN